MYCFILMWSKKNKKQILVFSVQINIDNNAKKKKKSPLMRNSTKIREKDKH